MVVGGLLAVASAGHVVYPAWLAWRTRGGRGRAAVAPGVAGPGCSPDLTVVVPAYREAGVIAAKVDDLRANGYPGSLEVLVVADGDPETAEVAERAGARALTGPERLGKSQALNRGFAEATTPIVVISDANNRLEHGAAGRVGGTFRRPRGRCSRRREAGRRRRRGREPVLEVRVVAQDPRGPARYDDRPRR